MLRLVVLSLDSQYDRVIALTFTALNMPRKKPRFHSLKKLVRHLYIRRKALLIVAECPPGLVTMVVILHLTATGAQCDNKNILPAEMGGESKHTSIPRRAPAREEVEAAVQEEFARGGAHGTQIPREI